MILSLFNSKQNQLGNSYSENAKASQKDILMDRDRESIATVVLVDFEQEEIRLLDTEKNCIQSRINSVKNETFTKNTKGTQDGI